MTVTRLLSLVAIAAAVAFAPKPAAAQQMEGVAAVVNDEVISTYDVRQRVRLILAVTRMQPTPEVIAQVQAQALTALVDERIKLQQAREFELEVTETEIAEEMGRMGQGAGAQAIEADLRQAGVDPMTLRDQIRADIAWNIIVNGRFRQRVRVSDDQISDALDRLVESASKPQYLISEIMIEANPGMSQQQVIGAVETVIGQLRQGAPFPAVARQFSSAPSAPDGGDVGWVRAGEMREEVERVVERLDPGQVSSPIETDEGIFIVALREVRQATDPTRLDARQLLVPLTADATEDDRAAAERALANLPRNRLNCEGLDQAASRVDGALVMDLGQVAPADLAEPVRAAVEGVPAGGVSAPIPMAAGVVMVAVCDRTRAEVEGMPTRDQIESRLQGQQLDLAARRYLRDLKQDATIEMRIAQR